MATADEFPGRMSAGFARLQRFAELDSRDRFLLIAAVVLRVGLKFVLHRLPYGFNRSLVTGALAQDSTTVPRDTAAARAVARAVNRSGAAVRIGRCLETALTGYLLLRAFGQKSTVRLGVGRKDGEIMAHAWLEQGGDVILNGPLDGLAPFPSANVAAIVQSLLAAE